MKELQVSKVAMTFGIFLGGWHLLWSMLVLLGIAQPLLDFVFWMHMIANPYHITSFTLEQSIILIVITFSVGFVGGWVFAWLWNSMHS